jgi:hypothetical protein
MVEKAFVVADGLADELGEKALNAAGEVRDKVLAELPRPVG